MYIYSFKYRPCLVVYIFTALWSLVVALLFDLDPFPMMKLQAVGALLGAFTTSASVVLGFSQLIPRDVVNKTSGTQAPSIFQQLIDHDEPHLGTFGQRYWFNAQYWAGSGAPVSINPLAQLPRPLIDPSSRSCS